MAIDLLKFLHLLFALGLIIALIYCVFFLSRKDYLTARLHRPMIYLSVLAMLTGTFLVYPKQFTFHTPWIQAAYFFVLLLWVGLAFISYFKRKNNTPVWVLRLIYASLLLILIIVTHDAVTKTTFLIS